MKYLILLFLNFFFLTFCFSQEKATLPDGTKIIVYPDKTWQFEEELNESALSIDAEKIIVDIRQYYPVYANLNIDRTLEDFPRSGNVVLDYRYGFLKLSSPSGRIGYVSSGAVDDFWGFKEKFTAVIAAKAREKGRDIVVRNIQVDEINSANGVDFSIEWLYLNEKKTIKYIYFTVIPYNSVGDVQTCSVRRSSSFTGKVTGPITSESVIRNPLWSTAWYNNTISCIKLTKVKVEYTDGTSYIYVNELPKILDDDFKNVCEQ